MFISSAYKPINLTVAAREQSHDNKAKATLTALDIWSWIVWIIDKDIKYALDIQKAINSQYNEQHKPVYLSSHPRQIMAFDINEMKDYIWPVIFVPNYLMTEHDLIDNAISNFKTTLALMINFFTVSKETFDVYGCQIKKTFNCLHPIIFPIELNKDDATKSHLFIMDNIAIPQFSKEWGNNHENIKFIFTVLLPDIKDYEFITVGESYILAPPVVCTIQLGHDNQTKEAEIIFNSFKDVFSNLFNIEKAYQTLDTEQNEKLFSHPYFNKRI